MPSIINATTTNGLVTSADNSGSLQLATNSGTTAVTIDTSQNVGIGTASPSTKLNVFGLSPSIYLQQDGGAAGNTQLRLNAAGGSNTGSVRLLDKYIWASTSNGSQLNFGNDLTTAQMIIGSDGGVFIGTSTAPSGSTGGAAFIASTNSRRVLITATTSTTSNRLVEFENPNGTVGNIATSGSGTTYSTSSDYRLKENIAPMVGALATVSTLKPVTYKWKTDGSDGQGFIAHELAEVFPDAVIGEKDAVKTIDELDAEGKVIGTKEVPEYQGIDTSFLVATLTAAIQELNAKVDAQALEIQALKGVA
jgi:hypothetical protein